MPSERWSKAKAAMFQKAAKSRRSNPGPARAAPEPRGRAWTKPRRDSLSTILGWFAVRLAAGPCTCADTPAEDLRGGLWPYQIDDGVRCSHCEEALQREFPRLQYAAELLAQRVAPAGIVTPLDLALDGPDAGVGVSRAIRLVGAAGGSSRALRDVLVSPIAAGEDDDDGEFPLHIDGYRGTHLLALYLGSQPGQAPGLVVEAEMMTASPAGQRRARRARELTNDGWDADLFDDYLRVMYSGDPELASRTLRWAVTSRTGTVVEPKCGVGYVCDDRRAVHGRLPGPSRVTPDRMVRMTFSPG